MKLLYMGCQWKELPIEKDETGQPEIHYTRIYKTFRRWESAGCINAIFENSVLKLHQSGLLDTSVIHGDGQHLPPKKVAITSAIAATSISKVIQWLPSVTATVI
jgi:hypothetical protein